MPRFGSARARRMVSGDRGLRYGGITVALLFFSLVCPAAIAGAVPPQQTGPAIYIDPAEITRAAGDKFEVNVAVEGMKDLGAFQLVFAFDPTLVQVDSAQLGPFIAVKDRTVVPLGMSPQPGSGQLLAGAVTVGTAPGASGNGVLLTLKLTALKAGQGNLNLNSVLLADTAAATISASVRAGRVVFTGDTVVPTNTPLPATATSEPAPATSAPEATATSAAQPSPATVQANPTAPATEGSGTASTPTPLAGATVTAPTVEVVQTPTLSPEEIETQIVKAATATGEAIHVALASGTITPRAMPTSTLQPGETPATFPAATQAPAATPASESSAATRSVVAPLLIAAGLVVAGAGALVYLRSRRRR